MKIKITYDKAEDIFYFTVDNRPAATIELEDNILLRVNPETNEFIGLTILFFREFMRDLCKKKNLIYSDEFIEDIKAGIEDMKVGRFLTEEEIFNKEVNK